MKFIQAIIEPTRLDAVTQALADAEIFRFTVCEVEGKGHHKAVASIGEGRLELDFMPMLKLEIALNDAFVGPAINAIVLGSGGIAAGIGKIVVLPLEDAVRVRTGERGPDAI